MSSCDSDANPPEVRIGIAGAGYWGSNLIRVCEELGVLASVCDSDDSAVALVKDKYPGVKTTSRFDELLSQPVDAVLIATPAQMHAQMCLAAINAGKHVFVEKPLALTVDEGERVVAAAEATGRIVFVGHLLLYHPAVKKLRCLLEEDAIGKVWHLRSRRLSLGKLRDHENVWWSFAPHDVALMLDIMGDEPQSVVAAQTGSRITGLNDVAYADFSFSGGRTAHVEVCWLDPEKSARLDVFGDKGTLTLNDSRRGSSLSLRGFSAKHSISGPPIISRGTEVNFDFTGAEPLRSELLGFIDAVEGGKPFPTSARDGVAVLRALSMADRALAKDARLRALA